MQWLNHKENLYKIWFKILECNITFFLYQNFIKTYVLNNKYLRTPV